MALGRCCAWISEPRWGTHRLQKAARAESTTERGEHIRKGWSGLVAIPGANRPDRARRVVRVLRKPEQDQVINQEREWSGPLNGARRLPLGVAEAQELFRVMERDLQAPAARVRFQDEPRF